MTDHVTVQFSRDFHRTVLGKAVVVTTLATVAGYFYDKSARADNLKASTLTLADYTSGFEAYKAHLAHTIWPVWGNVLLMLFMLGTCFLLYEFLGAAVGWLLLNLVPGLKLPAEPPGPQIGGVKS